MTQDTVSHKQEKVMIFVTVGTHEQPFDRSIREVDRLCMENTITEDVVMQTGYSTCQPHAACCKSEAFFAYDKMQELMRQADIVITHGGPASFIAPLQMGKVPIVVPRQSRYQEHVNDHQLLFCREVDKRQKTILLVEDIGQLGDTMLRYDELVRACKVAEQGNNAAFCSRINDMVQELCKG